MRRNVTLLFSALLLAAPLAAQAGIDKAGTTAANFLAVGSGADVLGMGGATLGFGSDLSAAAWNAAALGGLNSTEYVFSHSSLAGQSPQEWVSGGGRFGFSPMRWAFTGLYEGDGSFDGRDAFNNPTGSFNASSMALGFQLAQAIGPLGSIGVGAKYVSEKLGDVNGGGVTFDFGMRMHAGPFGFGAAAQNAFGKMSYSGLLYDFPTNYGMGLAYTLPLSGLTFALDANFPTAYYSDVRGGLEWRWHDRFALRTGYRKELNAAEGEPLGGPTFGMGAGANGFWFDYGYMTGGDAGNGQHRFGLVYHPGFMNGGSEQTASHNSRDTDTKTAQNTSAKPAKSSQTTSAAHGATGVSTRSTAVTGAGAVAAKTSAPASASATTAAPTSAASSKSAAPASASATTAAPTSAASSKAASTNSAPATSAPVNLASVKASTPASAGTGAAATAVTTAKPSTPTSAAVAPDRAAPVAKVAPPASSSTTTQAPAPTNVASKTAAPATSSAATSVASNASSAAPVAAAPVAKAATPPASATSKGFTDAQTMGGAPVVTNASAKTEAPAASKTETAAQPTADASKTTQVAALEPAAPAAPATTAPATAVAPATTAAKSTTPSKATKTSAQTPSKSDAADAAAAGPRPKQVKVKGGESLAEIAKRWNTTPAAIMMANNLVSESVKSGTTLKLPPANK